MNNTEFLLKYAEIGVLSEMDKSNPIKAEELKQNYLNIKKQLLESDEPVSETKDNKKQPGEKKESAVGKWFGGIGKRQKAYQEKHKDDLM